MQSVQLVPTGPFSEIPRSDTLFGAICWGIRRARGEEALEDLLARFAEGDPPFLLGSAFPTADRSESDGRLHLLPKPLLARPRASGDSASDERIEALSAWKRIEYLPAALLAELAAGERSGSDVLEGLEASAVVVDGEEHERAREFLLPAESGIQRPHETETRVRNAVNRLTGSTDGNLFERESVFFGDGAGLHVPVEGEVDTVVEGLALLQDRGIGGGKSVGQGQFHLDGVAEIGQFPATADAERFCTLSLCIPRPEELGDLVTQGLYEVETRTGVVADAASASDIWKRRVLALAEGSVLPRLGATHGHNPVVADHFEHGIQQYGYALPVGFER
jgi:CRISPR-associated protein Csm4